MVGGHEVRAIVNSINAIFNAERRSIDLIHAALWILSTLFVIWFSITCGVLIIGFIAVTWRFWLAGMALVAVVITVQLMKEKSAHETSVRKEAETAVQVVEWISTPLVQQAPVPVVPVTDISKPVANPTEKMDPSLRDSVATAITNANNGTPPPIPEFSDAERELVYLRWLGSQSDKLSQRIPDWNIRKEFLQTVWYESSRAGLDPALVLGLIETASDFRRFYVSENGARGYMAISQSQPSKLGNGHTDNLFHLQTGLRYGCVLLRRYLDSRKGDLNAALGDYFADNIAIPLLQDEFKRSVLANRVKWAYQDNVPVGDVSGAKQ